MEQLSLVNIHDQDCIKNPSRIESDENAYKEWKCVQSKSMKIIIRMRRFIIFLFYLSAWVIAFYWLFSQLSSSGCDATKWSTELKGMYLANFFLGIIIAGGLAGDT